MQVMFNSKVSNGNRPSEARFETLMIQTHILDHCNGDMYQGGGWPLSYNSNTLETK